MCPDSLNINKLMQNAIDLHVHLAPDLHPRLDTIDVAKKAKKAGMKALLCKPHYDINASTMSYLNKQIKGIELFGGITLNYPVGGLNPIAVEACINFGGKEVWMPSFHSQYQITSSVDKGLHPFMSGGLTVPKKGISILDAKGRLSNATIKILKMIKDSDIALGTSHLSIDEIGILIENANKIGIKKILVTHPFHFPVPLDTQATFVSKGAYLEFNAGYFLRGQADVKDLRRVVEKVGVEKCVVVSDLGGRHGADPSEGLAQFFKMLLENGLTTDEIEVMAKENPAKILNIDP